MRHGRQRPPIPPLWHVFTTQWLGVSPQVSRRWWDAVIRADWSRATALRSMVLTHNALARRPEQLLQCYQQAMCPRELIAGLEDLHKEQVLDPATARVIEAAVLRKTDRDGVWKDTSGAR